MTQRELLRNLCAVQNQMNWIMTVIETYERSEPCRGAGTATYELKALIPYKQPQAYRSCTNALPVCFCVFQLGVGGVIYAIISGLLLHWAFRGYGVKQVLVVILGLITLYRVWNVGIVPPLLGLVLAILTWTIWSAVQDFFVQRENGEIELINEEIEEENQHIEAQNQVLQAKNAAIIEENNQLEHEYKQAYRQWSDAKERDLQREYEKLGQLCQGWFPPDYCCMEAVSYFIDQVRNYRACTVQEMVECYVDDQYRQQQLQQQRAGFEQIYRALEGQREEQRRRAMAQFNSQQMLKMAILCGNMLQWSQLNAMYDIRYALTKGCQ